LAGTSLLLFVAVDLANAAGFIAAQVAFTVFAVALFCILSPLQSHVGIIRLQDIAIGGAIGLLSVRFNNLRPEPTQKAVNGLGAF
jgi:hypothetical protein